AALLRTTRRRESPPAAEESALPRESLSKFPLGELGLLPPVKLRQRPEMMQPGNHQGGELSLSGKDRGQGSGARDQGGSKPCRGLLPSCQPGRNRPKMKQAGGMLEHPTGSNHLLQPC